jgi:hypothetical protein
MRKLTRREAIREFGRQQNKPATEEIRRRLRDQREREQRLVAALETYARMGILTDRTRAH